MSILYINGDATTPIAKGNRIVVHCCNDIGGFGKGFALAVANKWPGVRDAYRDWYKNKSTNDFALGAVQFVSVHPYIWVANLIGQHGMKTGSNGPPIRYDAIGRGLEKVATKTHELGASVHMPRMGSGLAGGRWPDIEAIVIDKLCKEGIAVTVYDFA